MIGEIRQNFTEASASVGLILATALISDDFSEGSGRGSLRIALRAEKVTQLNVEIVISFNT